MPRKIIPAVSSLAVTAVLSALAACYSGGPSPQQQGQGPGTPPGGGMPFQADPPSVYVAKVKNILVGLAPTDAEVQAVTADPSQLRTLIDQWMTLPQYTQKMMRFFELAFQQTQVSQVDFSEQAYPRQIDVNGSTTPLLVQNAQESFARTMLSLVGSGRPFTDAMTTPQLMMTTAMKEMYAFLDAWQVDDAGIISDRFRQLNPGVSIYVTAQGQPIDIKESVDPTNVNFMHWYDPDVTVAGSRTPGCNQDPFVYPPNALTLHYLLMGSLDNRKVNGTICQQFGGTPNGPQLTANDFNDWTLVTLRQPKSGETPTQFYNLPVLRAANELVLQIPRLGFFSTPAFFANWQTNKSNEMRVTINQSLIVALGSSVDGTDTTTPPSTPGLDTAHASDPACASCHVILDPTRSIFTSTYSWDYHNQTDSSWTGTSGLFAFRGVVNQNVHTMSDFGGTLAQHPLFAQAWAQKLCYYVDSSSCAPSDPEFTRIVGVFQNSNYSWNALVKELLASPLTTNATETLTAQTNGETVAVSRRDHLCAALNARLGFNDVCGLDAVSQARKGMLPNAVQEIVSGLPSDGYGRGSPVPILPIQPTLFFRAGTENICAAVADMVIDVPQNMQGQMGGTKKWTSTQPDAAIADFAQTVMALTPSDPRSAPVQAVLSEHFMTAMQQGASATDALKSTFVVACLAPSSVSIGM